MIRSLYLSAFVLSAAGLFYPQVSAGQAAPPRIFVDRKVCPGEGCDYKGRAKVVAATAAYRLPDLTSAVVFRLPLGTMVTGIDSQVHTRAGHYVVKRAHKKYRKGDVLYVYTYLGEGFFKVWHRGRMFEEDLAFSVWGGSSGKRCEQDEKECWGVLEKTTNMKWWLKVRTNRGRIGWVLVEENLHWNG